VSRRVSSNRCPMASLNSAPPGLTSFRLRHVLGLVSTALVTLVIASCESDAPEAGVSLSGAVEAEVRQAIESDDLEIFRSLIADSELQRSPQLDGNPLLIAATIGRARAIVEHMLQQGVDPDQRDQRGTRALFLAIRREDVGTVQLLLDAGADPDEPSPEPQGPSLGTALTPLHAAVHLGNLEIVSLLIAAGADVNAKLARIGSPLETAIMTTDADALEMLVDAGATSASGVVIKDPLVGVIRTSRRTQDTSDHERMLRVLVGIGG
jgi:hypothetical protein